MSRSVPALPSPRPLPLAVLAGVAALVLGLAALEIGAENHRRALDLHFLQKRVVALEAINLELSAEVDAHVPGRLDGGDPLASRASEVSGAPARAAASGPAAPARSAQ